MTEEQEKLIKQIESILRMRKNIGELIAMEDIQKFIEPLMPNSKVHKAIQVTLKDKTSLTLVIL